MNAGLRAIPPAAGVLLAVTWFVSEPEQLARWVGVVVFLGLGVTFLVEGIWRRFWAELLAATGLGFMGMAREALLIGFAFTVPAIALVAARAWTKFQNNIVKEATTRKT